MKPVQIVQQVKIGAFWSILKVRCKSKWLVILLANGYRAETGAVPIHAEWCANIIIETMTSTVQRVLWVGQYNRKALKTPDDPVTIVLLGAVASDIMYLGQSRGPFHIHSSASNDLQALEEHVLENTARDNLSGPDLAFAAYHLQEMNTAAGINMSSHQLAARMGKNASYISSLLRIVRGAPEVARLWRDAPVQLSIDEMLRIVKLKDPKLQLEEYNRLLGEKGAGQTYRICDNCASPTRKALAGCDVCGHEHA